MNELYINPSVKTLEARAFEAQCIELLKGIRDTGEPLLVTHHGEALAIIQAPGPSEPQARETVAETLDRLRPLLLIDEEEFEDSSRRTTRR